MSWQSFEEVKEQALVCRRCRLHEGRTQVVWMDGNPDSELMFIGEAPGFNEDRIGKPFVGAAGKLLDQMLAEIGLDRNSCTICNVIKCRPPGNRNPLPDEIELCNPYLTAQVEFIDPAVIVTLGNFATRFILQSQISISKVRGQKFRIGRASVIPTFHPAAVLHGGGANSPVMASLRSDFKLISQTLEEAAVARASVVASRAQVVQDSLF